MQEGGKIQLWTTRIKHWTLY